MTRNNTIICQCKKRPCLSPLEGRASPASLDMLGGVSEGLNGGVGRGCKKASHAVALPATTTGRIPLREPVGQLSVLGNSAQQKGTEGRTVGPLKQFS